ncbi:MAG: COX15/CtaA family protein [candidate division NC10 bacterium]|nr:COX15/CtaA family protein [candidate division NC10 bacterium]
MPDQRHACIPRQGTTSAWLHRLALLTASVTLVLIFVGGLVTNTGSALAVPDWPTTFGYSMFLYPWSRMVGGIFYEHSHRLIGSAAGILTVTLAVWMWITEPRRWLRWLGAAAVMAVIVQGVLGGLRVILISDGTTIAIIHGCLAQAFFALTVSVALFTSQGWKQEPEQIPGAEAGRLRRFSLLTTGLIALQIVVGAILTHAGLLLNAHLLFAVLVTIHVSMLAARILRRHQGEEKLVRPVIVLCSLLFLQLLLGLGSYVGRFTSLGLPNAALTGLALPVTHRLTGALMLATCLVVTLRAHRRAASVTRVVGRVIAPEGVPA